MYLRLPFGLEFHAYSGDNWSHTKLAFVTGRDAGQAQRETALTAGFKSEHLTELLGEENQDDRFQAADGTIYYGRQVRGIDGSHSVSAKQVAALAQHKAAMKEARKVANQAAFSVTDITDAEAVTA
jgi:hypothetical protein